MGFDITVPSRLDFGTVIHHVKPRGLIRGSAGPILTLAVLLSLHVLGLIHSVALEAEVALAGVLLSTFLGGIRSGVLALVLVAGYLLGTNLFDLTGRLGKNLGESSVLMVVAVVGIGLVEAVRRRSLGIIPEREARQRAEKRGEVSAARLDHIGAVRWEADSTLRFTFVSSGGEQLLGYPTRTWYSESGFWENHLHPADRLETVRLRSEALKSGRSMELVYRMVGFDGRGVWVRDTSEVALGNTGSTASITGWMVDITQERVTQMQLRAVFAASKVLTRSSPIPEAASKVIGSVCSELGWALGALWTINDQGDKLRCLEVWHESEGMNEFAAASLGAEFGRGIELPGRVWQDDQPAWIADVAQDNNFSRADHANKAGLHAAFGVPIRSAGNILGVVEFFSHEILPQDDALLEMMDSIALQMGQFIRRRTAEDLLKVRNDKVQLLSEAGVLLASSSDLNKVLNKMCNLVVQDLADWCAFDLTEENGSICTEVHLHRDNVKAEMAIEMHRDYSPRSTDTFGSAEVVRTGTPKFHPSISPELIDTVGRDPRHIEMLRALGFASQIIVPLRVRGRILGTINLVRSDSSPQYAEEDLELAQELADRTALAIDNIRLNATQRYIAATLQDGLRPRLVEKIPGTDVAVRYTAAGEGVEMGGDFYDVFSYGQKHWAVVIGDVSGKGARAAALTPLIKYTVRSEAVQEREPSRILAKLNEAVLKQSGEDQFCTVAFMRMDQQDDAMYVTTVCAGHPRPLILRSDGQVERLGGSGTMLGAVADIEVTEHLAYARAGDAVVLFTDGAIEARADGTDFGEGGLIDALRQCSGLSAQAIAEHLEQRIIEYSQAPLLDDMVLLVVKLLD